MDTTSYKKLQTVIDTNIDRYQYNLARYLNDISVDLRSDWDVVFRNYGFDIPQDNDLSRSAYINVIKSVIDSLVSKIYNQKVRPYFTPVNGTFETRRVVKDIQQYFDILYDSQNINRKICNAFRNACVFDVGYILVNPVTFELETVPSHCVGLLRSEKRFGKKTKLLLRYLNYPAELLKPYGIAPKGNAKTVTRFDHFIDVSEHKQYLLLNGTIMKTLPYKADILPILELHYTEPVFDNTTSIVSELDGIQTQIDLISSKISAATQLSPANQIFVLEGSNLTPKDLNNKAGTTYGIKMPVGSSTPPVVTVTPPIFDPQWMNLIEFYIKKAYEIVGISELSSMSKKPSGLDSGTALQTMEDIESDRFETQVQNYINSFVELAKIIMAVIPEDEDILPDSLNSSSLKWKDVQKQSDLFKLQYSAATQLSKDPSENTKMIMQLSQIGQIPMYRLSGLIDNPDLKKAYNGAEAVWEGIQQCIARAIEDEDFDIPDFVNYEQLAQEIAITQNEMYASLTGDKKNDKQIEHAIKCLMELEANLLQNMEEGGFVHIDEESTETTDEGLGATAQTGNKVADITSEVTNEVADDMAENETVDVNGEEPLTD